MRGALSVTLQAFHYKNAWLLHYHRNDGEYSCLEPAWVKNTKFRTRYVRDTKVNLDTVIFVSPLSFRLVDLVAIMWHGSSSNISKKNKMGHQRFGFVQRCWYSSHNSSFFWAEIPWGAVKWHKWLGLAFHSNDKSRNGLAPLTQPWIWWRGSV